VTAPDLAAQLAATQEMLRIISRAAEIGARLNSAQTLEENDMDLAALIALAEDMRTLVTNSKGLFPTLDAAAAERMIDECITEAKTELGWS
jgi:uncharacterized protein YgbK (DUF1537 family)